MTYLRSFVSVLGYFIWQSLEDKRAVVSVEFGGGGGLTGSWLTLDKSQKLYIESIMKKVDWSLQ